MTAASKYFFDIFSAAAGADFPLEFAAFALIECRSKDRERV